MNLANAKVWKCYSGKPCNKPRDKRARVGVKHGRSVAGKTVAMGLAVPTDGLENFCRLLKRGIKGTYVSVEPFHLFRYLDEQAFRFNEHESDKDPFGETLSGIRHKRPTY